MVSDDDGEDPAAQVDALVAEIGPRWIRPPSAAAT